MLFTNLPSDLIFQAVKRIQDDEEKAINIETINHAYQKGWINNWERTFYINTWRKRQLTAAQKNTRIQINEKVLRGIVRARNNANG